MSRNGLRGASAPGPARTSTAEQTTEQAHPYGRLPLSPPSRVQLVRVPDLDGALRSWPGARSGDSRHGH